MSTPIIDSLIFEDIKKADTLFEAVGLSIGAASVCWSDMSGTGVFRDDKARAIMDALLERIALERPVVSRKTLTAKIVEGLEENNWMHGVHAGTAVSGIAEKVVLHLERKGVEVKR